MSWLVKKNVKFSMDWDLERTQWSFHIPETFLHNIHSMAGQDATVIVKDQCHEVAHPIFNAIEVGGTQSTINMNDRKVFPSRMLSNHQTTSNSIFPHQATWCHSFPRIILRIIWCSYNLSSIQEKVKPGDVLPLMKNLVPTVMLSVMDTG